MAQLILAAISAHRPTHAVLAVLADGVHPGKKVVVDPNVWDSTPLPKFRIVQVPGAIPEVFTALEEQPVIDPLVDGRGKPKRVAVLDLTGLQIAELTQTRKLSLSTLEVRIKPNPRLP